MLLANGALSAGGDEYEIRKRMIENDVVEAIIVLPNRMFYTTDISVTAWVLSRNKKAHIEKRPEGDVTFRDRTGEILFMDLRQMGHPFEKKYIEFTEDDRKIVTDRFKAWRMEGFELPYANEDGFCYSASKAEIVEKDYSLVPSRYITFDAGEEDVDYDARMRELQGELKKLMDEEQKSKKALMEVLEGLGYGIS